LKAIYDRSTLEHEKIKLQTAIRHFLISNNPEPQDEIIIQNAMEYIVKSHHSFRDQYFQILTFQYALDSLEKKYEINEETPSSNISRLGAPTFSENEPPF